MYYRSSMVDEDDNNEFGGNDENQRPDNEKNQEEITKIKDEIKRKDQIIGEIEKDRDKAILERDKALKEKKK